MLLLVEKMSYLHEQMAANYSLRSEIIVAGRNLRPGENERKYLVVFLQGSASRPAAGPSSPPAARPDQQQAHPPPPPPPSTSRSLRQAPPCRPAARPRRQQQAPPPPPSTSRTLHQAPPCCPVAHPRRQQQAQPPPPQSCRRRPSVLAPLPRQIVAATPPGHRSTHHSRQVLLTSNYRN
uniref:Uncharacterized protein n=2 Tax=Aegilops tauschii subsp. strangulata TaxID=200361 RepID=A0A452XK87_AEGTS